jgi:hypothetical protein
MGSWENIVMHPETKRIILGFYLLIYPRLNKVGIKHVRLQRATMGTLKVQTSAWPELHKFLVSRRKKILKGHRFEKFDVPKLAEKNADEILAAIKKS